MTARQAIIIYDSVLLKRNKRARSDRRFWLALDVPPEPLGLGRIYDQINKQTKQQQTEKRDVSFPERL